MAIKILNSGVQTWPKTSFVKNNNIWSQIKTLYKNINGIWTQIEPVPGNQFFTSNGSFVVPNGVTSMTMTAIGGGAGAGNYVDGGANDDYGGTGGGSSGQYVSDYPIPVTPGETITVVIGGGGGNAGSGRDSGNQGGGGGTTYIYTAARTYYLLGGVGGYGGSGQGNTYPGGTQTTSNSSLNSVGVHQGSQSLWGRGGYGGGGITGGDLLGGAYGGGNNYHYELDAVNYGGGGAGTWSNYVREDNGNHPSWGGKGKSGAVYFKWGRFQVFTSVGVSSFTVPNFVTQVRVTGCAGGAGGGNVYDDGCGGTSGSSGGGSSGQMISGYIYNVSPGQVLSVTVGGGGDRAGWGGNSAVDGIILYGGAPGGSGSPCNGGAFAPGYLPGGGPSGYFGYSGSWGGGSTGGTGGQGIYGYGGGGGGSGSFHGWTGQAGGNATYYGAGGGGAGSWDLDNGGTALGGYGYQGIITISW